MLYNYPDLLTYLLQLLSCRGDGNVRYENTYKMGAPAPELQINSTSVENMLSKLLAEVLRGHVYDAQQSARTAMDIATTARIRIKALALPRYTIHYH